MRLYLISQNVNEGYNTYDAAVVAAESEIQAMEIRPGGGSSRDKLDACPDWAIFEDVNAEYLGETDLPKGIVLASFNAG